MFGLAWLFVVVVVVVVVFVCLFGCCFSVRRGCSFLLVVWFLLSLSFFFFVGVFWEGGLVVVWEV